MAINSMHSTSHRLQFLMSCASGLTLLNNIAALNASLGGKPGGQVVFVSLFSIANACGTSHFSIIYSANAGSLS